MDGEKKEMDTIDKQNAHQLFKNIITLLEKEMISCKTMSRKYKVKFSSTKVNLRKN